MALTSAPVGRRKQEDSRGLTSKKSSYSPAQILPPYHMEQRCLEALEKQAAQEYGMLLEGQYIDSAAVLQEAKNRARLSSQNRPRLEDLEKLYHLRIQDGSNPRPPVSNEPPALTQGDPYRVDASRFWAVLIGIDAYKSNPLHGCVSDALSMKQSLIKDVRMSEKRIQCLLGSGKPIPEGSLTPTRANIVNTLHSLIDNPHIERGDNIIIYYAGHGSSYYCSKHYSPGLEPNCSSDLCPIEALCPIDRDAITNKRPIPDISDRELNALFTQVSRTKGHRITFIADCCHAGGTNRGLANSNIGVRTMEPTRNSGPDGMLRAADERMKHLPGYKSVLSDDWQPDTSSHVILAACQNYQTARETRMGKEYGGDFTRQLVRVLGSGDWRKETTYEKIAVYLNQTSYQTPVVSGDHRNERLWYQGAAT